MTLEEEIRISEWAGRKVFQWHRTLGSATSLLYGLRILSKKSMFSFGDAKCNSVSLSEIFPPISPLNRIHYSAFRSMYLPTHMMIRINLLNTRCTRYCSWFQRSAGSLHHPISTLILTVSSTAQFMTELAALFSSHTLYILKRTGQGINSHAIFSYCIKLKLN